MANNFKQSKFSRNEFYFALVFFAIAVFIALGIYFLKYNPILTNNFLESQAHYYHYWFFDYLESAAEYLPFVNAENEKIPPVKTSGLTIPVLVYHGIVEKDDGFNLTLAAFKDQMRGLKEAGYRTITMKELSQIARGEKNIEPNMVLLTFDDGRKDSYYSADPVLRFYDLNAVMFIITGRSLGKENYNSGFYINEMELEKMLQSGRWEIQSHGKEAHNFYPVDATGTLGHFYVNKLWFGDKNRLETDGEFKARILNDFEESKQTIKDRLGVEANALAFPFGDFGEESFNFKGAEKIVIDAFKKVYDFSFFQYWPRVDYNYRANYAQDLTEKSAVIRIKANPKWNAKNLLKVLEASDAVNLPYIENWKNPERWLSAYGDTYIDTENRAMVITTNVNGLAMTYLDGSYLWKNYEFSVHFRDMPAGKNTVSLVSHFLNSLNYDECIFEPGAVHIRQNREGVNSLLEIVILEEGWNENQTGINFSISSQGEKTICKINGKQIAETSRMGENYSFKPLSGGAGIKIWDILKQGGRAVIDKIEIN